MRFHINCDQLAVLAFYPLHDLVPRNHRRSGGEGANMKARHGGGFLAWETLAYFAESFSLSFKWFEQSSYAARQAEVIVGLLENFFTVLVRGIFAAAIIPSWIGDDHVSQVSCCARQRRCQSYIGCAVGTEGPPW